MLRFVFHRTLVQVFILDSLATYTAENSKDAESIIERVTPRLQHANSAVVLSAVKVNASSHGRMLSCLQTMIRRSLSKAAMRCVLFGKACERWYLIPSPDNCNAKLWATVFMVIKLFMIRLANWWTGHSPAVECGWQCQPQDSFAQKDGAATCHPPQWRVRAAIRGPSQHQPYCAQVSTDTGTRGQSVLLQIQRSNLCEDGETFLIRSPDAAMALQLCFTTLQRYLWLSSDLLQYADWHKFQLDILRSWGDVQEKLEIIIQLANDRNIDQVLLEFKEYATEVDVDFVRKVGHPFCKMKVQ